MYGIKLHHVDLVRTPYSFDNIKAYKQLVELIKREKIDYIHCNTPTGGILGRLAGKKCGVKVIYQAHGFHFYKGAPKKNWLLYYPVEKILARYYTDAIITINKEDFELAKKKFKCRKNGKVYYVPGVGIDISSYGKAENRELKRKELGLNSDEVAVISMGELSLNKNYDTAIRAIAKTKNRNIKYFICGQGSEYERLKLLAEELGVENEVRFLGFRDDIKDLLSATDIFLHTSKREGLPRSSMEAMASGLPCVLSKIRGNVDLFEGETGGFLSEAMDVDAYAEKIDILAGDSELRKEMGRNNLIAVKKFDIQSVVEELRNIYVAEFLND
jgi:glycosyltransferase involved in cell wall biosynthesis